MFDILQSCQDVKILLFLHSHGSAHLYMMSKEFGTYAHLHKRIAILEKEGLIKRTSKEGRIRIIALTKKGIRVADLLNQILCISEIGDLL